MIIRSILDTDLYKLTMGKAVLNMYPKAKASYEFVDRRKEGLFNDQFLIILSENLDRMSSLSLSNEEADWLLQNAPFLGEQYVEWLKGFRFNPDDIEFYIDEGNLNLKIKESYWRDSIYWEVPLMSMISEIYFKTCVPTNLSEDIVVKNTEEKVKLLHDEVNSFADFGTRRRRSYDVQKIVIDKLRKAKSFIGTSNVHFAKEFSVKPIGTQAHEWIMGISSLEGLRHANRHALKKWSDVYHGELGTALTDTFTTPVFLKDFNSYYARLFEGVRHDSGEPLSFAHDIIEHYKSLKIDPLTKTIVFSDGLDVEKAIEIQKKLKDKIKVSFGIGTHFTNNFDDAKALNMVIKLKMCDGHDVVKLSDDRGKQFGNKDALRVANWTFLNEALD